MIKSAIPPTTKTILLASLLLAAVIASAQTNAPSTPHPAATVPYSAPAVAVRAEELRTRCIQERRCVCGRVLVVMTNGLVIDSGYASLQRPGLKGTWHFPSTVVASRDPNLVEEQTPGSICVGQVFLTDLPRKRRAKIKVNVYDYVLIDAYPAGEYTYTPPGGFPHTVRCFACGVDSAVKLRLATGGN